MRVRIVSPNGELIDSEVRMNDIVDVCATAPSNGQMLRYNSSNSVWECVTDAAPGSYVDRGDPASWDFSKTDLTTDGQWHTLNLRSIIPEGATLVHLKIKAQIAYNNMIIAFCKKGIANKQNGTTLMIRHGNNEYFKEAWTACDADGNIEYYASDRVWVMLDILVRGWI